jgi:hypothetical protein
LKQETRYPWDGNVRLSLKLSDRPQQVGWFQLDLRIPGWCEGPTLKLNGKVLDMESRPNNYRIQSGYAKICQYWNRGDRQTRKEGKPDVIELDLPMPVERIEAHPRVQANVGRVAIQRGPIVYCFEGIDNPEGVRNIILARDPKFESEHRPDLLGGVTVIHCTDRNGRRLTAVPYYAWDHREPGSMVVWVRQDGKSRTPDIDDPGWEGKLYRRLDPATLGPSTELTIAESSAVSASHGYARDAASALNDLLEPSDSCDHGIPRFTWWDHRGTQEWVEYQFDQARKVSAVEVYWFDDGRIKRHCRVPKSWKLLYRQGDAWKPVTGASQFGTAPDKYNRVTFDSVETTGLRIEVQLDPEGPWSGGILEWKVE